jgi:hypothetical protein
VVERNVNCSAPSLIVELKGGTRVRTGPRWIRKDRPDDLDVRGPRVVGRNLRNASRERVA